MGATVNSSVVTAAPSYDLTTAAIVKSLLGITDTSADALLAVLIPQCSAAVANYCNRVFARETVKDIIRIDTDAFPWMLPGGVARLQLSRFPIVSVASVVVGVGSPASPLTVDVDYEVIGSAGQLLRLGQGGNVSQWSTGKITVLYDAGYTIIPADIQDATARLVVGRYYEKQRDPYLKVEDITDVSHREWWIPDRDVGNFPPEVADLLDNYRVPVAA